MTNALIDTFLFVLNLVLTLFASIVLLRFLLQWVKADFYNPFCQFVMRLTNPLLLPLRRIIPGLFGLDIAALVLVFLTLALNLAVLSLFVGAPPAYVFLLTLLVRFVNLSLNLYFFIIILRAFMSFSPHAIMNPLFVAMVQLTEPILRPLRKIIRPVHGFDLSALVVIILIQALLFFINKAVGM